MTKPRHAALPPTLEPFGVDRVEAAALICVGVTTFDQLVRDGTMPQPKMIKGRLVWDVAALRKAFAALPVRSADGGAGSWAGAF